MLRATHAARSQAGRALDLPPRSKKGRRKPSRVYNPQVLESMRQDPRPPARVERTLFSAVFDLDVDLDFDPDLQRYRAQNPAIDSTPEDQEPGFKPPSSVFFLLFPKT